MVGELTSQQMWYPNPVRRTAIIANILMGMLVVVFAVIIFSDLGVYGLPLIFAVVLMIGYMAFFVIRLEMKIKPSYVSVSEEGLLFRYKDESVREHAWDEIRELTMTPDEIGNKKKGIVVLYDSKHRIPIPYEAYEEAIVARHKKRKT